MLRNLASKSFDSASSTSSSAGVSTNGNSSSPDGNVYDKLRLLNGGQPWSQHSSAWYVPSPGAAAAAAAAFSQHINGHSSPTNYNGGYHDPLNENHPNIHHMGHMVENKFDINGHDLKKGKYFFLIFSCVVQLCNSIGSLKMTILIILTNQNASHRFIYFC